MSPGPPSPCSITSLQRSLSPPHDCNSISSVDGGCDGGNVTSSQLSMSPVPPPSLSIATAAQHSSSHQTMSSDLSFRKSVDLAAHGPSCPAPSLYDSSADDSNDCGCDCVAFEWSMSSDPLSRKSDDIMGPACPALSPYDSNTNNNDDDSDDVDDCGSDGAAAPQWTISSDHASQKSDDVVAQWSICPASTPYDSSTADDNTDGDASSQWSMSRGLPSDAISQQQQQAYDLTITAYDDVDYVATAQPSPTG